MTQKNYIKQLAEKINIDGKETLDVMQYVRMLLAYNRRILDATARAEFDIKVEEIYPDLLCKANKAKVMNDSATVSSLTSELVALCEPEIQDLFKASKTYEQGIYEVHNFVQDLEFAVSEKGSEKDTKKIVNLTRELTDLSLVNGQLGKDYKVDFTKVKEYNQIIYAGRNFDEKQLATVENVVRQDTNNLIKTEDRLFAGIAEELIKDDIRMKISERYEEKNKI